MDSRRNPPPGGLCDDQEGQGTGPQDTDVVELRNFNCVSGLLPDLSFLRMSKKFPGTGLIRPIYFLILISHIILAAAVPVLASITIYRALRGDWA